MQEAGQGLQWRGVADTEAQHRSARRVRSPRLQRGANVNRHACEEDLEEWTPVLDESELPEGQPVTARLGARSVLMLRRGTRIFAVADVCSHAGGPLHEGGIDDDQVTCPWHARVFRLGDGDVVHGPATAPQPAYEVPDRSGQGAAALRRSE